MPDPLFSIVVPAYNSASVIARAIDSISKQTLDDWELFIVDDGSEDELEKVVAPRLADGRIHYEKKDNGGASSARNHGVSKSRGDFIVFLDSDDVAEPDWLATFASLLGTDGDIAFCGVKYVHRDGTTTLKRPIPLGPLYHNVTGIFLAGTYALRKSLFVGAGGFDERLKIGENYDLGVRVASRNPRSASCDRPLLVYFKESKLGRRYLLDRIESKKVLLAKYRGFEFLPRDAVRKFDFETSQSLAVDLFRVGLRREGRKVLVGSLLRSPCSLKALGRLLVSFTRYYDVRAE